MDKSYRGYKDSDIIEIALKVKSMAELLRRLGLAPKGGNYNNMKRNIQRLNIDCSHWTGKLWSKGIRLKDWKNYTKAAHLKPHLIKERGHKCERCNLKKWENEIIPLEIDHIDGDRTNNSIENLKLLCPNCHALTPTWRGRKNKSR